ncbi:hypothetical protein P3T37_004038 [Kitasatospora sp. MAA4]|uniref:hypothetical protein n=1 Tax=Kitasatospora sp. MAA4 TaxID=3035093 RepID=UPI0024770B85|nr:hypothetical protein [Kitasatospora sp. MAA4]MDH6134634.1 hypothetical protein [Kitasatospora sp. MAA4]
MNRAYTPPDRLFLAAAGAAATAEEVRAVWRRAKTAGMPRWYLDRVAAIGRTKPDVRPAEASAGAA